MKIKNSLYRGFCIIIVSCYVLTVITDCSGAEKPIPSNMANVRVLSNNKIISETFEIPMSIFRGVLWPSKGNENFQIWTIEGQKENYYNISAPKNYINNTEVTKQWYIKAIKLGNKKKTYRIIKNDKSKSLELELPIKKRDYCFAVLKNELNNDLVIFMDISEDIKDKGLFGYILIY